MQVPQEIMEQNWGNLPQTGAGSFRPFRREHNLDHILFDFNILESGIPPVSAEFWHTNCLIKKVRHSLMAETQRRVLVIDPDPRERRDVAAALKEERYSVETGKNLSEAIKKVSAGEFSCLIMDINLPEMRGYEAVSILKSLDPDLRIIMTTRKNTKRLEAKVREQDIFFYFIKSFGLEELKLAIKNAFKP
jgi:CheY-like chemotaxis protein